MDTVMRITVYTDPLCCWSWGAEPHLDAVREAMGERAAWTFRMGGLLPSWDRFHDEGNAVTRPAQMGPVWMHAAQLTGRPIHDQIWITDPPSSSYPACIAVKCATLQSEELGERYLRAVQAACMAEGKNISQWPVLREIADQQARENPEDFNLERFVADYQGEAGKEAFRQDLQLVQFYQITRFPALIIEQKDRPAMLVTGYRTSSSLLNILQNRNGTTASTETAHRNDDC